MIHIDRCLQRHRVQERVEIAGNLAAQHALGDDLAGPQPAARDQALAGCIALIDFLPGVLCLVGGSENLHQGRAETRLLVRRSHE